jgi:hypothetical protein
MTALTAYSYNRMIGGPNYKNKNKKSNINRIPSLKYLKILILINRILQKRTP